MIDGKNFFDQPVTNNLITYDSIRKIGTGPGNDYTTGCLLDDNYFKYYCMVIAINLSKQQALDSERKALQEINFTGNLARNPIANIKLFFIIEEAKEIVLDFSQETIKVF